VLPHRLLDWKSLLSVRTLRLTVLVSTIVAVATGATSVWLIRKLARGNEIQAEIGLARVDSMSLYAEGLQMCQATRNILLDPSKQTAYANFQAAAQDFERTLDTLRERSAKLFPESGAGRVLASVEQDFRAHLQVQNRIHALARSGDFAQGRQTLNLEDTPLWRKYKQSILDFAKWLDEQAGQSSDAIRYQNNLAERLSWLSGLLLGVASLAAFTAAGRVSRNLVELARDLVTGANEIAMAAGQVASTSESLAQGASEQAASLQETSASGEEIRSMAQSNTERARSAAELAVRSQGRLTETNRVLDGAVAAMEEIRDSSSRIHKVIQVIDEIAFQTNILALNAAVEAARAGEAGMGFGVVADEVRNLARRCAEAAGSTAALIEASIEKSRGGKNRVDEVAVSIRSMAADSGKVRVLVEEVNQGSIEQAKGLENISTALAQIEQVTQRAAAAAQEGSAASQELNAQSETLRDIAQRLAAVIGS